MGAVALAAYVYFSFFVHAVVTQDRAQIELQTPRHTNDEPIKILLTAEAVDTNL